MALNIATFKKRSLTAVVFVIIMLIGVLWNTWSFLILFSFIHFGCWIEYQSLLSKIYPVYSTKSVLHSYVIMFSGYCLLIYAFVRNDPNTFGSGRFVLLFAVVLIIAAICADVITRKFSIRNVCLSFAGLAYISLSWALMIDLRMKGVWEVANYKVDLGWVIPAVLIASIWLNDTLAYVVGSMIGKTSLSAISPNKTWEGTVGGGMLAIVLVTTVWYFFITETSWKEVASICCIAVIIGTIGDLLESKLKRMAKVKDSGTIMPGHGGFLDRFDSLILAIPFTWLFIYVLDEFY